MRIIKFRVSHRLGKTFNWEEIRLKSNNGGWSVHLPGLGWVPMADVKLEQFTGSYDKNDKEVYEGDTGKDINGVYIVKYMKEYTCFMFEKKDFLMGVGANAHSVEIIDK